MNRGPGDTVEYISLNNERRIAIVQRWVETTIIAIDTKSNEEVVFDQFDHIQWERRQ